MKFKQNVLILY